MGTLYQSYRDLITDNSDKNSAEYQNQVSKTLARITEIYQQNKIRLKLLKAKKIDQQKNTRQSKKQLP